METFLDIICLHNGAFILHYVNYPDILSFMKCSKRTLRMVIEYGKHNTYSFYGIPITIKGMWGDLFYQRYNALEQSLLQGNDSTVTYYQRNIHTGLPAIYSPKITRFSVYYGLCLLEIAYMLRDPVAITLLERHKRTIRHCIYPTDVLYGTEMERLCRLYST